jgi:hypothetical protein
LLFEYFTLPSVDSSILLRERREHAIFKELLKTIPGLEERLVQGSEDELAIVAELVGTHEFVVVLYLIL